MINLVRKQSTPSICLVYAACTLSLYKELMDYVRHPPKITTWTGSKTTTI